MLDEIGTLEPRQQAKLLRVLEAGEVERVGASRARKIDVRIVSATNAELPVEVAAGRFREDLLFRLNTIEIRLPPLRERGDDIRPLAEHFLRRYAARYRKPLGGFEPDALQTLQAHAWPGNVRELDHTLERAVLMAHGAVIRAADLGLRAAGARARDWRTCRSRRSSGCSSARRSSATAATSARRPGRSGSAAARCTAGSSTMASDRRRRPAGHESRVFVAALVAGLPAVLVAGWLLWMAPTRCGCG